LRADLAASDRPEDHLFNEEELIALVPVDFSLHSKKALASAFDMARKLNMKLHLLHLEPEKSWEDIKHILKMPLTRHRQMRLDESDSRLKALVPADLAERVTCEVRLGQASREAVAEAKNRRANLVVMGVHEKDALQKWIFGATSSRILSESPCPVWFVSEKVPFDSKTTADTAAPA
jgi:nucleotide-binding universal stress UspA family protein